MANKFEFFYSWFLENKDNIIGREVNEVYTDYCDKACKAKKIPYYKKTFIEEVNIQLDITTKQFFIKIEDAFSIKL